jgi:predicted transcriptional regulator
MALVREAGGALRTTTRRLGVQLGRPAASVHGELRRLATAGLISLNADSRGTLITVAKTWTVGRKLSTLTDRPSREPLALGPRMKLEPA